MFSFRPTNCSNKKKKQELKNKVSVLFEYIYMKTTKKKYKFINEIKLTDVQSLRLLI